ncbi:uncharacterized protein [Cebidichthys violaceus]|uniref:uncharacterized protein n=1 Tax=Cebidichthys violaceus TaxID=271503 RepID=UPI0035CB8802
MPPKKQQTGNIRSYCKISTVTRSQVRVKEENDGDSTGEHSHRFTVKFSPNDRVEYSINCDQTRTVLEAIKSSKKYQELMFTDENIVIQLGKEDRAFTVATHFPCSCIRDDESLILSFKKKKVEAAQDQHHKTVHSRDKYSVFYIDTGGGQYTKTKKLFISSVVKQFKYLCVYGEKGMTVEEALKRDGRFINDLNNFTLSDNKNPSCLHNCTEIVDKLDGKEFKICLPRNKRSNENMQETPGASDNSQQRRERDTTPVVEVLQQRGTSVTAAVANKYRNIEEIHEKLHEQFPGLKGLMESRFPDESYQEALDLRRKDFGKIQHSFSEVHRLRKLQIICIMCVRRCGGLQVRLYLSIYLLSLLFPSVRHGRTRIKYDRATLLQLGELGHKGFFNLGELDSFPELHRHGGVTPRQAAAWGSSVNQRPPHKCVRRGSIQRRLRHLVHRGRLTLPVILFANVQSLVNKMDELLCRIATQRYIQDCSVLCFCETWLGETTPDEVITPGGYKAFRADRKAADCGKTRGGGTAIFVKQSWCTDTKVISQSCSEDVEYITLRCKPFYLPRRLQSIILSVVYVPPCANEENALRELYDMISTHENTYPDAAVVVLGDFNHCNLKKTMPKLHQFVNFPTRGNNTLDHCYSNIKKAYTAVPKPHFGRSDHLAILLQPTYIARLRASPVTV